MQRLRRTGIPSLARRAITFSLALILIFTSTAVAQDRLPPGDLFENPPLLYEPIQPAGYPGDLSQPVTSDYHGGDPAYNEKMFEEAKEGYIVPQQFSSITKSKDGFFQKLYLAETYIPRDGEEGLGFNDVELALSVALPLPTRRFPLVITPGFTTHFLDGPASTDLPPRLYDAYLSFNWYPQFTQNWGAIVSIAPSVFSDFEHWSEDGFRTPGKVLLRYTWAQYERELVLGVIYLDRDDVPWLPAAGVIWTPNPYLCLELLFPRPRVLVMVNEQAEHEDWVYVAGEFGGGSWSIKRQPAATQDVVTFADYRLIVGVERRQPGGAGLRIEAGYIFGRTFEYESSGAQFEPEDAWMVRGSVAF